MTGLNVLTLAGIFYRQGLLANQRNTTVEEHHAKIEFTLNTLDTAMDAWYPDAIPNYAALTAIGFHGLQDWLPTSPPEARIDLPCFRIALFLSSVSNAVNQTLRSSNVPIRHHEYSCAKNPVISKFIKLWDNPDMVIDRAAPVNNSEKEKQSAMGQLKDREIPAYPELWGPGLVCLAKAASMAWSTLQREEIPPQHDPIADLTFYGASSRGNGWISSMMSSYQFMAAAVPWNIAGAEANIISGLPILHLAIVALAARLDLGEGQNLSSGSGNSIDTLRRLFFDSKGLERQIQNMELDPSNTIELKQALTQYFDSHISLSRQSLNP